MSVKKSILKSIIGFITFVVIVNCYMPAVCIADDTPQSTNSGNSEKSRVVVSMGDSYSSGEGITPFYGSSEFNSGLALEDWLAHRSKKSWGGQLIIEDVGELKSSRYGEYPDPHWYFVASSGAETKDILGTRVEVTDGNGNPIHEVVYGQLKEYTTPKNAFLLNESEYYLPPQIDILYALKEQGVTPDYIILTIGGNDLGFVDVVTTAATSPTYLYPFSFYNMLKKAEEKLENETRKKLNDVYHEINNAAKDEATGKRPCIIVAGYPGLLDTNSNLFDVKTTGKLFSKLEAEAIDHDVKYFNYVISQEVEKCKADMDIVFVDVLPKFVGHEAYSKDPWINGVKLVKPQDIDQNNPISAASFHPNEAGAKCYAECVQEAINNHEQLEHTPTLTPTPIPVEIKILTEEEARIAFRNYLIKDILPNYFNNYSYEYMRWGELEIDDDYCKFSWEHRDDRVVEYTMNLISGTTKSVEYSVSNYDVISEGEFDFNAWEYLENFPQFYDTKAIELKSLLGMENDEAYVIVSSYGDEGEKDASYGYCYKSDHITLHIFDAFLSEPLDYVGCVVLQQSDSFSIYGVTPGMEWEEALKRFAYAGALYAYSQDYHYLCFEMEDGNWVGVDCSESGVISTIALAKSASWFHFVDGLTFTPKLYYKTMTDDVALSAITNYINVPESTLEDLQERGIPCYWGIASSTENEIVIHYRSYTGFSFTYHVDRNTGFTHIFKYFSRTGEFIFTNETFNAWDYYDE